MKFWLGGLVVNVLSLTRKVLRYDASNEKKTDKNFFFKGTTQEGTKSRLECSKARELRNYGNCKRHQSHLLIGKPMNFGYLGRYYRYANFKGTKNNIAIVTILDDSRSLYQERNTEQNLTKA